ncbi:putative mitochondrial pyruvate carrier 2 [Erysiphe neolycopersici]|uniref:Mitochondrial pyruvate carrier n=1 Tax=Erysiphe neolycopersici TaxID=212602 RepID=A0A420HM70_9PEZI|nr:putative mitochondrial pyruvate carrier 2 [Erysiphe neolycopersici]
MSPTLTSTVRTALRPSFRFVTTQGHQSTSQSGTLRQQFQQFSRRWQGTVAPETSSASWIKRMWDSPIGIKTVHFWAPVMKWSIVLAGVSDFYRPAEKLSLTQNLALTSTGLIWTRWCLIIKPKNMLLATVNFFLGMVGIVQVSRILAYRYGNDQSSEQELNLPSKLEGASETAVSKIEEASKS